MAELMVQVSEPIYHRLEVQAHAANMSVTDWLTYHLSREFNLQVATAAQARERTQAFLHESGGLILRAGEPRFEAARNLWHVPVRPRLREGKPKAVGEICLDATTGDVLSDPMAVGQMLQRARPQLGLEAWPADKQTRLDELLESQREGTLPDSEQQELTALLEEWEIHNLDNLLRLSERTSVPATRRTATTTARRQLEDLRGTP
jgi:hypothetical protein